VAVILGLLRSSLAAGCPIQIANQIPGVETTTGVHRLHEMLRTTSCCSRPSTSTTR
jgi:hypothetical protein